MKVKSVVRLLFLFSSVISVNILYKPYKMSYIHEFKTDPRQHLGRHTIQFLSFHRLPANINNGIYYVF